MEVHKAIGMVIGGRAARACDVCGQERARWYCAADEAYLCERCDSSVHSANAVAKRHDRVRLGPNGAPMKIERSSTGVVKRESSSTRSGNRGARKKPRTSRLHPSHSKFASSHSAISNCGNSKLAIRKVKAEPSSPEPEGQVPEHQLLQNFFDSKGLPDDVLLHEVPIYMSMDQELPVFDCADLSEERPANESSIHFCVAQRDAKNSEEEELDLLVPDNCIDIDSFLDEGGDLYDLELDMDCIVGQDQESLSVDGIGILSFRDDRVGNGTAYDPESLHHGFPKDIADYRSDGDYEEVCQNGESPRSWLCKVKVESPPPDLEAAEVMDVDSILGERLNRSQVDGRTKLGLTLNFEDVLSAWSDRGSLWMDGQRPQIVPDETSLDYLGGLDVGLVPDLSFNNSCSTPSGDQLGQVPVVRDALSCAKSEAREARVMRYKEKRRTRLFSKKIRYEVRKLNAEKRPRMKGRFVKRISSGIAI